MSRREYDTTIRAWKLDIGPRIISHEIVDHKPTLHEYIEEDELSEWERYTQESSEWYNVTMEELYPIDIITYGIYRIVSIYCETLMSNGIYHMDLHRNNIMLNKDGKIVIIDYGFILLKDDPYFPFSLPTLDNLVGGLGIKAKGINVEGEILKLFNYSWSPYWNALFTSSIGYDKDDEENAIFNDFDVEHLRCYINYCDHGYINYDTYNEELFEYMGHDTESRLVLQKEWKKKYDPNGNILYEEIHIRGIYRRTDELMEIMDKFFYDVDYILLNYIRYDIYTHRLIVFCKQNMEDNTRIALEGYYFDLEYVEDGTKPIDYIKKMNFNYCYSNGRKYTNTPKQ